MTWLNPDHFVYKLPLYYLSHRFGYKPPLPFSLTFSVTNVCQSRCKTCKIWDIYRRTPHLKNDAREIEKMMSWERIADQTLTLYQQVLDDFSQ
jgi:hypothetical protein